MAKNEAMKQLNFQVDDAMVQILAELEIRLGVKTSAAVIRRAILQLAEIERLPDELQKLQARYDNLLSVCQRLRTAQQQQRTAEQEIDSIIDAGAA